MYSLKTIYKVSLLLGLLTLGGCKTLTPVKMPSTIQTTESFTGRTDTTSIGQVPWKVFFQDPYLVSLIDTALRNNPDLKIAVQRIEMARADVLRTKGFLLPSVQVEASTGVRKYGDYTMDGVGNYDTNFSDNIDQDRRIPSILPDYFLGLRSSWEIDIWGRLRTLREAAYARYLATEQGRQLVVTRLVAEISSLYYELLTLDSELGIIRKNKTLQESALETIQIQKEGGRANELGVRQFRAQLLNTQSLEIQKQQQIIEVENMLNALLGRFPQQIARGESILQQKLPEELTAGIPATMLRRRPDIRQAELELRASKADLLAARAAFLPSLTVSAHAGFNAFNAAFLFNPASLAYGLLGGLTAPVFNRKALEAGRLWAQASSLEALSVYNQAVVRGYQEVVTSIRGVENLGKIAELKSQEALTLQQAVAVSNDLYLAGYATYLEVITAQRSVLQTELELAEIQKQQFLVMIDLYRSLGGGWE
ncbi:efflux transporter outer membrane subunit [Telluribacter humicola]|uniref:efflux transporter outer membrane subunit n=1 Tax=Telluribacter humicola TaxID=1720261 RepID=UPI001A96F5F7|nr:efflux transporter outer membrane subunit [Telluribacter humicola]